MTPALSAAEVEKEEVDVTFLIWLTARSTSALIDSALAGTGLTGDEFAIYSVLASGTDTTPSTLARWMAAPATTVSSYVKRFEARGHLEREANPDDKRSFRIVLTAEGRDAHRRAGRRFADVSDALVKALGSEEETIKSALRTLRPVLDHLRQLDDTGGSGSAL